MNIEEIRKKKLEEFQGNMNEQQQESFNEQLQIQQEIKALEENLKQYLTREAIERYYNIKSGN
jgi:DNA-binding TFAR19-related protein (PDSD5 family)